MPTTIVKEGVLSASHGDSNSSLEEATHRLLHAWLFTAGFSISKEAETAAEIRPQILVDPNWGGLRWKITKVDRKAGWIQYEMDPTSVMMGGPVLTAAKGDIQITETSDDKNDGTFQIVWKLEYQLSFLLTICSCGFALISTRDMFKTLMEKDLNRVIETPSSEVPPLASKDVA